MTVGMACRSCGTGLREDAKFCDECGSSTEVSVNAAKYKQVTVLFADVVRSTDIAEAVDMERLREIMTDFWNARRRWCAATAEPSTTTVTA